MTSNELKHEAKKQEWNIAIQECRGSGLSVSEWCQQRGVTTTTYYRWERELLTGVRRNGTPPSTTVTFAELPAPKQVSRNVSEHCATLHRLSAILAATLISSFLLNPNAFTFGFNLNKTCCFLSIVE